MRRSSILGCGLAMLLPVGVPGGEPPDLSAPVPTVHIDEAHGNYHTADGRYAPFAGLLRSRGFPVARFQDTFTAASLADIRVLVIANATHPDNMQPEHWRQPVLPAFSTGEVDALDAWVAAGGRLWLIADHMPFPGAARELAGRFGFVLEDGYVFHAGFWDNYADPGANIIEFHAAPGRRRHGDGHLAAHPVTLGGGSRPLIPWVATFTGHGFAVAPQAGPEVTALMVIGEGAIQLFPQHARDLGFHTTEADIAAMRPTTATGLLQGALREYGAGRVAMFGEAGMFTEQDLTAFEPPFPHGKQHPRATHNGEFALNVLYWLAEGVAPGEPQLETHTEEMP